MKIEEWLCKWFHRQHHKVSVKGTGPAFLPYWWCSKCFMEVHRDV